MSKKAKSNSRHKPEEIEAMLKNRSEDGERDEPTSVESRPDAREQDPKRRIGQFSGRGEPPLMKK